MPDSAPIKTFRSLSQRLYFSQDQGELPLYFRFLFQKTPNKVVQPHSIEEVVQAVRESYQKGSPIVPRGAASTAFGQTIPVCGGTVLDLNFLKGIHGLDMVRSRVTVESGVRWADLSAYLEKKDFTIGSYPSSWYSTVGGWVATGGYGINSLKFKQIKDQVEEMWVCFKDAQTASLKPGDPRFDAYFQTEGQMGIILTVTLKVRKISRSGYPYLVPAENLEQAWKIFREALDTSLDIFHSSLYDGVRMHHFNHTLSKKMAAKNSSAAAGCYFQEKPSVFFYFEEAQEARKFLDWLKSNGLQPAPAYQGSYVWEERFYPLKGKSQDQMFLGNEALLDSARALDYIRELEGLSESKDLKLAVEVNAASRKEVLVLSSFYSDYKDDSRYLDHLGLVFQMDRLAVKKYEGRLYHVGIYNTPFLSRKFSADQIQELRSLKRTLDPRNLFNPGKFFTFKTALTSFLPSWMHLWGARAVISLLRKGWILPFLRPLVRILPSKKAGYRPEDSVFKTMRECVNCGFCLPVCPAFLATQDERTTARGKLFLAGLAFSGEKLTQEDVQLLHSCMHCGGCTKVCQSTLDLVPAWYELESRVAKEYGKPVEAVEAFVKEVEANTDYKRLLRNGYISLPQKPRGAPAPEEAVR